MRKMNCRSVRREIEEVPLGNLLSASASDHLRDCPQCTLFREDRLKLREMLASLGAVEAPGDFDFRLRARLANEKRGGQPFVMRNLSFGFRSVAVVATLLLIGSALLVVSLRSSSTDPLAAGGAKSPSTTNDQASGSRQTGSATNPEVAISVPAKTGETNNADGTTGSTEVKKVAESRRLSSRGSEVAWARGDKGGNQRLKTLDTGISPARGPGDASTAKSSNVFPINASYQSLKVSLDDGRGSSRTISVPSVSFGSQRVLSPSSSSLLASARSDW
jgi:hypothetical protein